MPALPVAHSFPVPYLAQSAARASRRFWKKFLPPPAALCPSSRAPTELLVAPPPDGASLSASGRRTGIK